MQNIVYHGSNVEVPVPRVLQNGFIKILDMVFIVQICLNRRNDGQ